MSTSCPPPPAPPSIPSPRESGQLVTNLAKHVTIDPSGVEKLANWLSLQFKSDKYSILNWKGHQLNPKVASEDAIEWIFLVDSLNFSFWSEPERLKGGDESSDSHKYVVQWKGERHTGYWALCAAVNRAAEEGINLTDANYVENIDLSTLETVFRSVTEHQIPMLSERHQIMKEHASVLTKHFDGKFSNCVKESGHSAQKLLRTLVQFFPSFRDEASYKGHQVSFYKRAQILIGDIWACFEGKDLGQFDDIDTLTMFADYRIPQVLYYFGAIGYSDHLLELLKNGQLLQSGCEEEVEIRAASIWAVELALQAWKKEQQQPVATVNSVLIDYCLWDYRRANAVKIDAVVPFHKVRSIYY